MNRTENFKNSTFEWFSGELIKNLMMLICRNCGKLSKNYLKNYFLCAHRLHVSAKFGVFSSYGFRETISGHDRQTDGQTDGQMDGQTDGQTDDLHSQIDFFPSR